MEIVDNTDWTLRYQSHGFGQTEPVHWNCNVSLFIHPIYLITNISPVIDLLKKHTQAPAKKKTHFIHTSLDWRWGNLTWVDNGQKRFPGSASKFRNKDLCVGKYPLHHVFNTSQLQWEENGRLMSLPVHKKAISNSIVHPWIQKGKTELKRYWFFFFFDK